MKEENQKKSEVKNQNETFENRYLRPRSGLNLTSQKPLSYPSGFKTKAVADQTATISRPQNSIPELKDSNPTRPKVVAPMPQARPVSRPSGVTPLTPQKHLASPASDSAAPAPVPSPNPVLTSLREKLSSLKSEPVNPPPKATESKFTRPAGTPKPESSLFANPESDDPRIRVQPPKSQPGASSQTATPHLTREKIPFNANQRLERKNMEVTRRDLDIMQFALEMKFISREDVFEKYFSLQRNQEAARSNRWALERLAIEVPPLTKPLESSGFRQLVV